MLDVQWNVSGKLFKFFYANYIESFGVEWNEDVMDIHTQNVKSNMKWSGMHMCRLYKEDI